MLPRHVDAAVARDTRGKLAKSSSTNDLADPTVSRVAFLGSFLPRKCGIATFTLRATLTEKDACSRGWGDRVKRLFFNRSDLFTWFLPTASGGLGLADPALAQEIYDDADPRRQTAMNF